MEAAVGLQSKSAEAIRSQLACRVNLYLNKAWSRNPELSRISWTELWGLTRPGVPFHCSQGTSLAAELRFSAYASQGDRIAGDRIFHERCAVCHGTKGSGGPHGPSLIRPELEHGDSDLAVFRILRDGIPGTAMPPAQLPIPKLAQVIAYVRALQARLPEQVAADPPPLAIHVSSERLRAAGSRPDEWLTYAGL